MKRPLKLEAALYRNSYIYFILFFFFMLWGFSLTYFARLQEQSSYRMHFHGICLILWCLLLIIQPYLIRTGKQNLHRKIGKTTYLLVPVLIYSTLDLFKFRLPPVEQMTIVNYHHVALIVNAMVLFAILYGLALHHRRNGPIHARYMLSTAFPMFTPITDRIIYVFFPSLVPYAPKIAQEPVVPIYGFVLADLLLLGLSIWDWRSHKRWNIFPIVLIMHLVYHYSVLRFHTYAFWEKFSLWFAS